LYVAGLALGSALIVALNLLLIPALGLKGAVIAAIVSTVIVDAICVCGLIGPVGLRFLGSALGRTALALALTVAAIEGARRAGADPCVLALVGSLLYPLFGIGAGLVRRPGRSQLLHRDRAPPVAGIEIRTPSFAGAERPPYV
jgi:hypothetical protein